MEQRRICFALKSAGINIFNETFIIASSVNIIRHAAIVSRRKSGEFRLWVNDFHRKNLFNIIFIKKAEMTTKTPKIIILRSSK